MPRVVHFKIMTEDTKKAAEFYQKVFGWTIKETPGRTDLLTVNTGSDEEPGINGAIQLREYNRGFINHITVPSIDEYIKKVEEAGGKIVGPKESFGGFGYLAYCSDLDGNNFGIFQIGESA
jgi:predicted enzyme related to lactoylglutathione lyase